MKLNTVRFEQHIVILSLIQLLAIIAKIIGWLTFSWGLVLLPLYFIVIYTILILGKTIILMQRLLDARRILDDELINEEEDGSQTN